MIKKGTRSKTSKKRWFAIIPFITALALISSCDDNHMEKAEEQPTTPLISLGDEVDIFEADTNKQGDWWTKAPNTTFNVFDGESETFQVMVDYQSGEGWIEGTAYPLQELFSLNLSNASYAKLVLVEHYVQTGKATLFEVDELGQETALGRDEAKLKSCGATNVSCWVKKLKNEAANMADEFQNAGEYAEDAANYIADVIMETFSEKNMTAMFNQGLMQGRFVNVSDFNKSNSDPKAFLESSTGFSIFFALPVTTKTLNSKLKFDFKMGEYNNTGKFAYAWFDANGDVTIPELNIKVENKIMVLPPLGAKSGIEVTLKDFTFNRLSFSSSSLGLSSAGIGVFAEYFVEHKTSLKIKIGALKKNIGSFKVAICPISIDLSTSASNFNKPFQLVKNAGVDLSGYYKMELELKPITSFYHKVEWTYGGGKFYNWFN